MSDASLNLIKVYDRFSELDKLQCALDERINVLKNLVLTVNKTNQEPVLAGDAREVLSYSKQPIEAAIDCAKDHTRKQILSINSIMEMFLNHGGA